MNNQTMYNIMHTLENYPRDNYGLDIESRENLRLIRQETMRTLRWWNTINELVETMPTIRQNSLLRNRIRNRNQINNNTNNSWNESVNCDSSDDYTSSSDSDSESDSSDSDNETIGSIENNN